MRKTISSMSTMIEYENLSKLNKPFQSELEMAFKDVLNSGWFVLGKNVEAFESEFASYNDVDFCTGVASGLDALTLSIRALNLDKGSEILVPSNTYIATVLAILHNGFKPVFVEPDISTYNIDPGKIENKISDNTRAIVIVHLYGKACDMDPILEICTKYKLYLIEDCAQAHGAEYKGRKVGSFGDFGAFSFYPTKNLGCLGDGGAIVCKNKRYFETIRMLRNYGSEKKYYNELIGFNSRLDEMQAAFLRIKLKSLNKINEHKRMLADLYFKELNGNYILPSRSEDFFDVFHIFSVRHEKRDELKDYLLNNKIKTEIHYPVPPHKQNALTEYKNNSYPNSEEIHNTTLSLPISFFHSKKDILRVIEVMNKF